MLAYDLHELFRVDFAQHIRVFVALHQFPDLLIHRHDGFLHRRVKSPGILRGVVPAVTLIGKLPAAVVTAELRGLVVPLDQVNQDRSQLLIFLFRQSRGHLPVQSLIPDFVQGVHGIGLPIQGDADLGQGQLVVLLNLLRDFLGQTEQGFIGFGVVFQFLHQVIVTAQKLPDKVGIVALQQLRQRLGQGVRSPRADVLQGGHILGVIRGQILHVADIGQGVVRADSAGFVKQLLIALGDGRFVSRLLSQRFQLVYKIVKVLDVVSFIRHIPKRQGSVPDTGIVIPPVGGSLRLGLGRGGGGFCRRIRSVLAARQAAENHRQDQQQWQKAFFHNFPSFRDRFFFYYTKTGEKCKNISSGASCLNGKQVPPILSRVIIELVGADALIGPKQEKVLFSFPP